MSIRGTCLCLILVSLPAWGQEAPAPAATPESAPAKSPTWRESLDAGRDKLANQLFGIKASAFGDALDAPDDAGQRKLNWGSFELDLAGEFFDSMDAAFASVTSHGRTLMTVGFLDFHPYGGIIAPRGRLWVEKGFHVQAGRFDIPFGNDWQFFASKDSVSISRPLTTDSIMDGGYNDVGVRALGNDGTINFNTFILRGFNGGRLAGGRLGFTPFGNPFSIKGAREQKSAEFGFSYLYDTNGEKRKQEIALAADAEGRVGNWYARAEYLRRDREPDALNGRLLRHGWHVTQEYALPDLPAPTTFFVRYERVTQLEEGLLSPDRQDARWAGGASLLLKGIFLFKAEWQHYVQASAATREAPSYSPNVWLAQLVVVF